MFIPCIQYAITLLACNTLRTVAITPVSHATLNWSKRLDMPGSEDNNIVYANGFLWVSNKNCGVHVLDMHGEEVGKIEATENKTCPSGLSFAYNSSFFVLAGFYSDEET